MKNGHALEGEWGRIYRKVWREEGKRELLLLSIISKTH